MYEDECWYCQPRATHCPTSAVTVSAPTPSGGLAVAGEFGQSDRRGLRWDLNPSWVPLTRDADTYQLGWDRSIAADQPSVLAQHHVRAD